MEIKLGAPIDDSKREVFDLGVVSRKPGSKRLTARKKGAVDDAPATFDEHPAMAALARVDASDTGNLSSIRELRTLCSELITANDTAVKKFGALSRSYENLSERHNKLRAEHATACRENSRMKKAINEIIKIASLARQ